MTTNDSSNTLNPDAPVDTARPDIQDNTTEETIKTIDFYTVGLRDEFRVEFDTTTLGYPSDAPATAHVTAIMGNSISHEDSPLHGDWNAITCVTKSNELYVVLQQNPDNERDIRCSISIDGGDWHDVHFTTLTRITSNPIPVLDPHGSGTAHVA